MVHVESHTSCISSFRLAECTTVCITHVVLYVYACHCLMSRHHARVLLHL